MASTQLPANVFDGAVAASYDAALAEMFDPTVIDPTVDFLAALAGDRRALEFAVGTGRKGAGGTTAVLDEFDREIGIQGALARVSEKTLIRYLGDRVHGDEAGPAIQLPANFSGETGITPLAGIGKNI